MPEEHEEVPPAESTEVEQKENEDEPPAVCETDALKEVMTRLGEVEGYGNAKEGALELKQMLVLEPGRINTEAGRLKTKAKDVNEAIDAKKKEQSDFKHQMEEILAETEALRNDNAADRVERKKVELTEEQEKKKQCQETVEQAQAAGKQPFESKDLGSRYVTFLTTRGDLLLKTDAAKTRYTQHNEAKVAKEADTDALLDELRTDEQNLIRTGLELDKLQAQATDLRNDGWEHDLDLEPLQATLSEAKAQHDTWKSAVYVEVKHRAELAKRVETFMEEQQSLLGWITSQQQNLKILTKGNDIVEFCTSLHGLVNTMEENVTVLQDMSEAHLPNEMVSNAMLDLSSAWFKLNITSYDMLVKTLVEQHAASGVREGVAAFAEWQRGGLKELLDDAEELLQTPENPKERELVAGALEVCKELQKAFQPHLLLMDHLSDFEVRMELIEDQYHPMLATVESKLTALCQRLRYSIPPTWQGKKDYERQMNSLNDWIEARDTDTTSWEVAKGKVSKLCVTMGVQ